jgi:hypothetical protein
MMRARRSSREVPTLDGPLGLRLYLSTMTPYKRASTVAELKSDALRQWAEAVEKAGDTPSIDTLTDADFEVTCPYACNVVYNLATTRMHEHVRNLASAVTERWYDCPLDQKPIVVVSPVADRRGWQADGYVHPEEIIRTAGLLTCSNASVPPMPPLPKSMERVEE